METDDENIVFNELLKPSVSQVGVDLKLHEAIIEDRYQLQNLNDVFSCTIQETSTEAGDISIDLYHNVHLNVDVSESSVESLSSITQAGDKTLQKMISYCFDKREDEQENLSTECDDPIEKSNKNRADVSVESRCEDSVSLDGNEEVDFQESFDDDVYLTSEDESIIEKPSFDDETSDHTENIAGAYPNKTKRKYKEKKLTRKRICRPENWDKNIRKNAVNHGLEYKHLKTDETVPSRSMKRSCGPGCRFRCDSRINETRREEIFNAYWNTKEQADKYNIISRLVSEEKNGQENESKKSFKRTYNFINEGGKIVKVCKTMFLNTLDISQSVIETVLKKERDGMGVLKDLRGTSTLKTNKVPDMKTNSVIEHINMFPRVDSHYSRKDSSKDYLDENLCVSEMYRLYLEWAEENNRCTATMHHYTDIFNTQFNISFFKPKKDKCNQCEKYENSIGKEKLSLKIEYDLHMKNKGACRDEKDKDILFAKQNAEKVSLACFDFEKVLSTPKTDAGCLYYKRKLSVYNFTIYDIMRHKAYCYVWSEDDARKGSNEVASCLLHYFQQMVTKGIDNFLLYSDNCSGQNRNKNVFAMYTYASSKYKIDIKHTFLEVGHTQNEGDSVHSLIERHSKGRKIYCMSEWCDIIKSAKVNGSKYEVINVTYDMIYDFKDLAGNQNWNKMTVKKGKISTTPVGVSKFRIIQIAKAKPNQLQFKTSFENDYVTLATRKDKVHANVAKYDLCKAYKTVQGLPKLKHKDLLDLCKGLTIPPAYHDYYKSFTIKINKENEAEYSGDEGEEYN